MQDSPSLMESNLFADLPAGATEEQFLALVSHPPVKIERIVSIGHRSPPGFWYDQPDGEWVVVLAGAAQLRFDDEPGSRQLLPGDWVDIAPHRRHRVEWTDPSQPTIWLAVHYR